MGQSRFTGHYEIINYGFVVGTVSGRVNTSSAHPRPNLRKKENYIFHNGEEDGATQKSKLTFVLSKMLYKKSHMIRRMYAFHHWNAREIEDTSVMDTLCKTRRLIS